MDAGPLLGGLGPGARRPGVDDAGRALGQRGPHGASLQLPRSGLSSCHGNRLALGARRGPARGGTRRRATRARVGQPSGSRASLRPPPPADPWTVTLQLRGPRGLSSWLPSWRRGWRRWRRGGAVRRGPQPPPARRASLPPRPQPVLVFLFAQQRVPHSCASRKHCFPAISVPLPARLQTPHLRKQMQGWSSGGPRGRDRLLSHQGAGRWGPGSCLRPQHPAKCLVNLNCRKEFSKSPVITGVSG